jgi:hypothetical protein
MGEMGETEKSTGFSTPRRRLSLQSSKNRGRPMALPQAWPDCRTPSRLRRRRGPKSAHTAARQVPAATSDADLRGRSTRRVAEHLEGWLENRAIAEQPVSTHVGLGSAVVPHLRHPLLRMRQGTPCLVRAGFWRGLLVQGPRRLSLLQRPPDGKRDRHRLLTQTEPVPAAEAPASLPRGVCAESQAQARRRGAGEKARLASNGRP